jgi:ribonucleoside-diphosphate reductase alpha chain
MSRDLESNSALLNKPISTLAKHTIVKRDGRLVPFNASLIQSALECAFRDTKKIEEGSALPDLIKGHVRETVHQVMEEIKLHVSEGAVLTVETIQDLVEKALMDQGHHGVAKDYIIYRETRKKLREDSPRSLKILRRDGQRFVRFNPLKIITAVERAFRDTHEIQGPISEELTEKINALSASVIDYVMSMAKEEKSVGIEMIQDFIEEELMRSGHFHVARDYILYRAARAEEREKEEEIDHFDADTPSKQGQYTVVAADGSFYKIDEEILRSHMQHACKGYEDVVSVDELVATSLSNFYEGIKEHEVDLANMMAARVKIEKEPAYAFVAASLLLDKVYRETMGVTASSTTLKKRHTTYFKEYLKKGVALGRLSPALLTFDLEKMGRALDLKRDHKFQYLGLQTLYDRYFIHENDVRLETPQIFWMRVSMGLAINEGKEKERRAIEFYNVLSNFLYLSSTPTLFNSGTVHSQLSSCYLSTVMDDLHHIYKVIADDAQLSKWAGGLGNDWTNVRATGARIKGTNGRSQGVIPFLKVANDTAVAVNQGGKRKGAMCAYLETWHLDIEDFLELRKNTGDERRRTHDMNTANWIPDLFMKRLTNGGQWTLFSPDDVCDLHHLYGKAFDKRYEEYEKMADNGEIKLFKRIEAQQLWRKMLGMLFETGHPWITFKDPSNIRSPQDHMGVVHSSNLCTEILLNTSRDETAVCNLGSVNLKEHLTKDGLDFEKLGSTVKTAIRMLDNVIDINFYPTKEARNANMKHRPIGLGMMGFQDALYALGISYASQEAVELADKSMEMISYYAILSSSQLAKEKGTYESYKGSKWERGMLPIDTLNLLKEERGEQYVDLDTSSTLDWEIVRAFVKKYGMRNSNTMAIAPTATIANISGVTASIEPMYKHLFVKSNLSGEFTIVNTDLVSKLKSLNLWDNEMLDDLKYFDGSINEIERIPEEVKTLFPTAFEMDSAWLIECAARRQKWIDMGQSLNLYIAAPSGKQLHEMYMLAWKKGLKTTYYLRAMAATQIEKSSTDINKRGLQPRWMKSKSASSRVEIARPKVCSLEEGCESCQ